MKVGDWFFREFLVFREMTSIKNWNLTKIVSAIFEKNTIFGPIEGPLFSELKSSYPLITDL
jgi:hypothetical protein